MLRIILMFLSILACYSLLLFRLWNEQVRYGEKHAQKISKQSIRCIREPGIRGKIFTSDMKVIADLSEERSLLFHLSEMRKPGKQSKTVDHIMSVSKQISQLTGHNIDITPAKIRYHIYHKPALPMRVIEELTDEELGRISEIYPKIAGIEIGVDYRRTYPYGDLASHVIGYIGKGDSANAKDRERFFYYQSDYVGKSGIEKLCDKNIRYYGLTIKGLRGVGGYSNVMVDTQGFVRGTIETFVPPEHGTNLVLTIDFKAQETAEFVLLGRIGAFVLLNCENGDVLAMASSPAFNPGVFVPSIDRNEYSKLSENTGKPFINRATSASYTPGSIMKPLIALAILKEGISPSEKINCPGYVQIGKQRVRCWRTDGHGELDMRDAIAQSCNVYFMKQGMKMGLDSIKNLLEDMGIGKKTGFELSENSGLLPSREFKKRTSGEKWTVFDTAILSIGQGTILVTPLQVATYMAAIANRGKAFSPRIIKAVYDSQGNLIRENTRRDLHIDVKLDESTFELVRNGLFDVVNSEHGSGKRAASEKIRVFGKTGTAEIKIGDVKRKNTWMAGFAEKDGVSYAYAMVIEDGISGGSTCAPQIKQFFNNWID